MPHYDYKCTNRACADWGKCVEVFQKMSDEPLKQCPTCSKDTLFKCVTAPRQTPTSTQVVGAGDTTTVAYGEDGKPYRFKSGTVQEQKRELAQVLNRREEQVPEKYRRVYNVD
jgi:putative FmdB family regulatory protein